MSCPQIDEGRSIHWGPVAADYARYRPGPPQSYYDRLRLIGVGLATVRHRVCYDEAIWFTREEWRGRMRALRGIGASLPQDQVEAFDREQDTLLRQLAPDRFPLMHRIDAHVFTF